jgi:hypothetical protein
VFVELSTFQFVAMADRMNLLPRHPHSQIPSTSPDFILDLTSSICTDGDYGLESVSIPEKKHTRRKSIPWTSRPQPLRHGFATQWWRNFTIDILMVLLPIPFFTILATVLAVNGRVVEEHALGMVDQSIKGVGAIPLNSFPELNVVKAATVFPIVFAAVTGRAAVKFATWKLERGASIGLLEQLMGSRTVASAVITPLYLRSFNILTLGLVALWCMSPLGSQSVLHIFSAPTVHIPFSGPVTYFNLRQQSYGNPNGNFERFFFDGYSMLFGASLIAPTGVKSGHMDLWGNPMIPYLSSISSAGISPDNDGWLHIPQDNFNLVSSSLFGLPLHGVPFGNTTVNVETSYMELSCGNITTVPQLNSTGGFQKTSLISPRGPFFSAREVNEFDVWAIGYMGSDIRTSFYNTTTAYTRPRDCPDCLPGDISNLSSDPGILVYQEFLSFSNATSITCTPSQIYVESTIFCQKTSNDQICQVTAQRPSRLPHAPSTVTYLSFPQIALGLTNSLYNSTTVTTLASPIQSFLYNLSSNAAIFLQTASIAQPDLDDSYISPLYNISMTDFGRRFGQIINAWIHGSFHNSSSIIIGSPFSSLLPDQGGTAVSFVPVSGTDLTTLIQNQTAGITVLANSTADKQIYLCNYAWTTVFFFASASMLFSAILGVVFSRKTAIPDYLGYVSSLAKESKYMRIPDGGAALDGFDRARMIKSVHIRLGNVYEGEGDIGRLAVGRVDDTKPVQRNGLYI